MIPEEVLDAVRPPRMRPALWHALRVLLPTWRGYPVRHDTAWWRSFERAKERWEGEWAKTPELAALGHCLLARHNTEKVRAYGCRWLTMFPSLETVAAMEAIALDASEPHAVREVAVATLGNRRLEQSDDTLLWEKPVIAAADAALLRVWRARPGPDAEPLRELPAALRHVADVALLDEIGEDLLAAVPALEAFASKALARRLLASLPAIPDEFGMRMVRLVGYTLGAEAVDPLLAFARDASFASGSEALMTALALDAPRARSAMDAYLASLTFDRVSRERAALHAANPGVIFNVQALAIARTTGTLPREERTERCREAAAWFAALARVEPFPEAYQYGMWRHVARRAGDDASIIAAAEATPDALEHGPFLVAPYLDALARAGRFKKLASVALTREAGARATYSLARMGRPFSALAARRAADGGDPEAIAGEALALFLAGRPDLSMAVLEKTPPRSEHLVRYGTTTFPGPDEQWRLEHEPARWPALQAVVGGLPALLGLAGAAPDGADPDAIDFTLFGETERRLVEGRSGWSVDLPHDLDAATVARFRKTVCPNCGAPKCRPSLTAFVYCDHCGSLADFDLQRAGEAAPDKPSVVYDVLLAQVTPHLERAFARSDVVAYRDQQRVLLDVWVGVCPNAVPPRAREPVYRHAYVAHMAERATAMAFDETARLYAVALAEATRAVELVSPAPGVWRATPASFEALCRVFFPQQAHASTVFETYGITAMHPDRASAEIQRRIDMSAFVQEWLPKLDAAHAAGLLKQAGMTETYAEAEVVRGDEASCTICGSDVVVFEGARCTVCESCGHRLDVHGERIKCIGCGAPLAPGETATQFSCPHCRTEMKRVL